MSRQPHEHRFILLDDEPHITAVEIPRWWVADLRRHGEGPLSRAVLVLDSRVHGAGALVLVSDLYDDLIWSPWWIAGESVSPTFPIRPEPPVPPFETAQDRLCALYGIEPGASWESILQAARRQRIAASDAAAEHNAYVGDLVARTLEALGEDPQDGETFEDDVIPAVDALRRERDRAVHELAMAKDEIDAMARDLAVANEAIDRWRRGCAMNGVCATAEAIREYRGQREKTDAPEEA